MMPVQSISARQSQLISPRLQQAVRLLQLSSTEFSQEFGQALASNPFLDDESEAEAGVAPDTQSAEPGLAAPGFDLAADAAGIAPEFSAPPGAVDDREALAAALRGADSGFHASPGGHHGEDDPCSRVSCAPGLREHLLAQLCGVGLSARDRLAAELVIETLDEDGYLRQPVEETCAALPELRPPLAPTEIARAIGIVQELDPGGVGARDLAECLLLQLRAGDRCTPVAVLARRIVGHHLDLLARHDAPALRQALDCEASELERAIKLIRSLDPRPGERFGARHADYVVPDVIVYRSGSDLAAAINPAVLPRARLNRAYVGMLRHSRDTGGSPLWQQLREARWLLRSAEQRFVTIKRVADAILRHQRRFFDYGDIALKPLRLRAIAEELGLHESTISRATTHKYMSTPRGIFEFKHFFSRELATATGGRCSATAIRALIREMIDAEAARAPLSDVQLAQMLSAQGIRVARRTVTKYRRAMKLPPAERRRQQ